MEYRNLGRSGLRVSRVCLGTMMFGGATDAKTGVAIVNAPHPRAGRAAIVRNYFQTRLKYSRRFSPRMPLIVSASCPRDNSPRARFGNWLTPSRPTGKS